MESEWGRPPEHGHVDPLEALAELNRVMWQALVEPTRTEDEKDIREEELIDLCTKIALLGMIDVQNRWRTRKSFLPPPKALLERHHKLTDHTSRCRAHDQNQEYV